MRAGVRASKITARRPSCTPQTKGARSSAILAVPRPRLSGRPTQRPDPTSNYASRQRSSFMSNDFMMQPEAVADAMTRLSALADRVDELMTREQPTLTVAPAGRDEV